MASNIVEILIGAKDDAKLDLDSLKARLDELAHKVAEARVSVAGDKEAELALDRLGVKLTRLGGKTAKPSITLEGALKVDAELAGVDLALDRLGKKSEEVAGTGGAAGGGLSALSGMAMPALIGAAGLLSPVITTLAFGLGGFGLAAAGAVMPIENAAKQTGGLQANMKLLDPEQKAVARGLIGLGQQFGVFQKALQPEVLGVFRKGLQLASGLMHDVQPVAQATGKALGGLIGQIDQEFRSNNWQNFFHFMAQTAGPDIKLLGDAFVSLTGDLPPLLEGLQPVAEGLLNVVKYTGDAIRLSELASTNFSGLGKAGKQAGGGFNATTEGAKAAIPGMEYISRLGKEIGSGLDVLYGNSGKAGSGMSTLGSATERAAAAARDEAAALRKQSDALTASLGTLDNYVSQTITTRDDLANLNKTLQASGDRIGYKTQKERDSFAAAQTFIGDTIKQGDAAVKSGQGIDAQIKAVQSSLGPLESVKGKTAAYNAELSKLRGLLATLRAEKAITDVVNIVVNGALPAGSVSNSRGGFVSGGGGGHLLAAGGIAGAASGGLRSNLTMVGERGPELVQLSAGSRVYNNSQTQRMMSGAGGGGGPVIIQIMGSGRGGSSLDAALVNWIQDHVRTAGGGDVQVAFGSSS